MREIRTSGSEGGGIGNSTDPPYPYFTSPPLRGVSAPASDIQADLGDGGDITDDTEEEEPE